MSMIRQITIRWNVRFRILKCFFLSIKIHFFLKKSVFLFSHSVISDFLWPHGLQYAGLLCPSPAPRACSNPCLWGQWCTQPSCSLSSPSPPAFYLSQHSVFPVSRLFTSGGRSVGVPTSASVLPMNIQCWFPLGLTGWVSLQSKIPSRVLQHHS